MKKLLAIVVLGLLWNNVSFATPYSTYNYKPYYIDKKNKEDRIYNILANNWNNFLKAIDEDKSSCDSIPVTLTAHTEMVTCYHRNYEKHMRRNDLNVNQKIIDAFYDHYSDVFDRMKSLQVNWIQTAQRGRRQDVEGDVTSWVLHHDKSFKDTLIYSKNEWIRYAEIQSSNFKRKKEKEKNTVPKNTFKSGSGFYINNKGYFVTNFHVVDDCSQSEISFNEKNINVKLIATDKSLDLALLKAEVRPKNYLNLSDDPPEKLQRIYVAGYPFGKGLSDDLKLTQGIISSVKGYGDNSNQIQIDAAINSGNSGGPIVDEDGDLVGVAVSGMKKSKTEGIAFGIKSAAVKNFLDANKVKYSTSSLMNFGMSNKKLNNLLEDSAVYTFCN